jgi:hypothetical protein
MQRVVLISLLSIILFNCNKKNTEILKEKERDLPRLEPNRYNVAFLIMDGVYNTEFTAPYDIFQHTQYRKSIKAMNTFTVANTLSPSLLKEFVFYQILTT